MVGIKCFKQEAAGETEPQPHGVEGTALCVRDAVSLRWCSVGCGAEHCIPSNGAFIPAGFLNISFLALLALLLFKAIPSCNTSFLVSLKIWQPLREERKGVIMSEGLQV